jgi:sporulation protein YlmC with PRC-barrel domain
MKNPWYAWVRGSGPQLFSGNHTEIKQGENLSVFAHGLKSGYPAIMYTQRKKQRCERRLAMGTAKRTGLGSAILSAGTLKGDAIVTMQGEALGSLEEIMIDMESGRACYAVIAGTGDKMFAIPWESLTLDARNRRLVTDIV